MRSRSDKDGNGVPWLSSGRHIAMPSADNRIEDQTEVDSKGYLLTCWSITWSGFGFLNQSLHRGKHHQHYISHPRLLLTMAAPAASRFQRYRLKHIRLIVVYGTQKLGRRQCISVSLPYNSLNFDANVRVIPTKLNYIRLVRTRIDILGRLLWSGVSLLSHFRRWHHLLSRSPCKAILPWCVREFFGLDGVL